MTSLQEPHLSYTDHDPSSSLGHIHRCWELDFDVSLGVGGDIIQRTPVGFCPQLPPLTPTPLQRLLWLLSSQLVLVPVASTPSVLLLKG